MSRPPSCPPNRKPWILQLEPADNVRLANLCGQLDQHLRQLERRLGIEISNRGVNFRLIGDPDGVRLGEQFCRISMPKPPRRC